MHWIAPSEKDTATDTLEKRLCAAAEQGVSASYFPAHCPGGPTRELTMDGVEKTEETGRLCRMEAVRKDLAVHELARGHPPWRPGEQLLRRPA